MATAWDVATSRPRGGRAAPAMVISREAAAEWGGLWVGLLGVATVFLLFLVVHRAST